MKRLLFVPFFLLTCAAQVDPGDSVELATSWEYRPAGSDRYHPVPVPQFLNRVRWWLDDSKDFDRHEAERLRRLPFDTSRLEEGWYRRFLDIPKLDPGRRLYVAFDGVAMKCRTYLDGNLLGEHTGMFSRFEYDLTPYLKAGRNRLDVWVSMERAAGAAVSMGQAVTVNLTAAKVLSLSKGMFGPLSPGHGNRAYDLHGIWQPVRPVLRAGEGRIGDAWFVPSLTGAGIHVEARGGARVRARLVDPRTETVFAAAGPAALAGGRALLTVRNLRPRLWTPAEPNLYRLEVSLESPSGETLDRVVRQVGFRTFEVRGNRFYLNGHPYWLRGANQLPYGKNPWDRELPRVLIRLLHDANVRITRTHATPWNEAWLDAADEIGLGVSVEGVRPWALAGRIGTPPKEIFEHWLAENDDVVRRCRNHPSVLLWTVGNEMLLRDAKNLDKWRLLSQVVRRTRELDPTRPVICSSDYLREPGFYEEQLKPGGIDDGDADDIHRYRGWYQASPFVTDSLFASELERNRRLRPLIGQEMSTGYPDLDTGLPVARYTNDLATPQAWVGRYSCPGSDPAIFLEHHRAVTKRWAEQLRFQRGDRTAGFQLFSAECWFWHSFDAARARPYPVVEAVRQAFAPAGLALETARRRFFAGERVDTAVFVTNDDERFRGLANLRIEVLFDGAVAAWAGLPRLAYGATARAPVTLAVPPRAGRLTVRLVRQGRELSRTTETISVFPDEPFELTSTHPSVLIVRSGAPAAGWRARVESGATAILLSPGEEAVRLFPNDVESYRAVTGEHADWGPLEDTPLAAGLQPMDLKWWARKNAWRMFVASGAHTLKRGGKAREMVRFVPAHSYIPAEQVPRQYMAVLFEVPAGKGRVWVCDLDLESSVGVDPAARRFARNLLRAAAYPASTRALKEMPRHAP